MFEEGTGANDTDASIDKLKFQRLAEMSVPERIERFFSLLKTARAFTNAGIRHRYPEASVEEFKKRKAALLLGRDYAIKRYGWDPDIEGY